MGHLSGISTRHSRECAGWATCRRGACTCRVLPLPMVCNKRFTVTQEAQCWHCTANRSQNQRFHTRLESSCCEQWPCSRHELKSSARLPYARCGIHADGACTAHFAQGHFGGNMQAHMAAGRTWARIAPPRGSVSSSISPTAPGSP